MSEHLVCHGQKQKMKYEISKCLQSNRSTELISVAWSLNCVITLNFN